MVNVSVAVPPLAVTVAGLVLPNPHDGAGVTAGAMLQESVTLPVYPLDDATVMVAWDDPPGLMEDCVGVPADSEYEAGGVTVRFSEVDCVRLPEVPVMVTLAAPRVAIPLAVSVS